MKSYIVIINIVIIKKRTVRKDALILADFALEASENSTLLFSN